MVQPPPMAQIYVPPGGPPQSVNNINPNYLYPGGPPGAGSNNMNPNPNNVVRGTYIGSNNNTANVVVGVPL